VIILPKILIKNRLYEETSAYDPSDTRSLIYILFSLMQAKDADHDTVGKAHSLNSFQANYSSIILIIYIWMT